MNIKPNRVLIGAFSFLAALAVLQPAATAQTVTLTLVAPLGSPGDNLAAGGVYLSPYYFSINGNTSITTPLICDDFSDEISQGESWTATVTTGQVPATNYGGLAATGGTPNQTEYEEIGYLASLLLTPPTPTTGQPSTDGLDQTALSYALWAVLDPALDAPVTLTSYLGSSLGANGILETTNVNSALTVAAAAATANGSYYLNGLTIYQPTPSPNYAVPGDPQNCGSTCGTPQQFVTFNAPEALSPTFLVFDLLTLFIAAFLVRRRGISNAVSSR